jgi:GNAT superfamily N-acetyltransferase
MIRPAAPGDYEAITILTQQLGVDDPVPALDTWLRHHMSQIRVYDRDGVVLGYTNTQRLAVAGHVLHLVVAEQARRGGIGYALMREVAARLAADGVADWHLNVKADNAPAIGLYERLGMRPQYRTAVVRVPWDAALPEDPAPAVAGILAPGDDAEVERAFGLLAGRLAVQRSRVDRVLLELREGGAVAGVAILNPSLGCMPFRVVRPTLAAGLIRAVRPHAPVDWTELQLVVENDDALADVLVAAGAQVKLRLIHYAGQTT